MATQSEKKRFPLPRLRNPRKAKRSSVRALAWLCDVCRADLCPRALFNIVTPCCTPIGTLLRGWMGMYSHYLNRMF
ncbi:hypothetical protein P170DRAFT_245295 [Aspergillus steynii IBT 23096]|uniref:Uncharacterized protein n=1 Tax=Aspergillus steynii IBT 23096 TaxID=1392250 RepID=A0A2I2FY02_9EURO|nr:uncharacterized protein P170DRAFT_245295 [Aspergillus steynii IBT 23096]PLB45514.1 hypothetical protein P170DRAFT_245295 [Aspergillus steynii IBT 23096]